MTPGRSGARLFAEDLFHRLALGEFVDEFVEVADLAHHRLLNLLHADAANDPGDQKARRVHLRRMREEILEARLLRKLGFQRGLAVAGLSVTPVEDDELQIIASASGNRGRNLPANDRVLIL